MGNRGGSRRVPKCCFALSLSVSLFFLALRGGKRELEGEKGRIFLRYSIDRTILSSRFYIVFLKKRAKRKVSLKLFRGNRNLSLGSGKSTVFCEIRRYLTSNYPLALKWLEDEISYISLIFLESNVGKQEQRSVPFLLLFLPFLLFGHWLIE